MSAPKQLEFQSYFIDYSKNLGPVAFLATSLPYIFSIKLILAAIFPYYIFSWNLIHKSQQVPAHCEPHSPEFLGISHVYLSDHSLQHPPDQLQL